MVRTLEVGRAVLASSTQHLELWLTTLIIISPSQHSIDLEQLSSHCLLRLLSSGNLWVDRGRAMPIQLSLTFQGEPLPFQDLRELVQNICQAPIWLQLKLAATCSADTSLRDGVAHVVLSCLDEESLPADRRKHHNFTNVPANDLNPPQKIPRFELQEVCFLMDVVEGKLRAPVTRSNTSATLGHSSSRGSGNEVGEHEDFGFMSQETNIRDTTDGVERFDGEFSASSTSISRKRKRCESSALETTSSSQHERLRKWPFKISDWWPARPPGPLKEQMAEIKTMVDGAMRLSVCGSAKSLNGLKIKANTFSVGLVDVAPILWRPGYLGALAQRAHLLPTISRSLGHIAGTRSTSVSLSEKLKSLTALVTAKAYDTEPNSVLTADEETLPSSQITDRLWQQLQKALLVRSTLPLQAFVTRDTEGIPHSDQDDILVTTSDSERADVLLPLAIDDDKFSRPRGLDAGHNSSLPVLDRGLQGLKEKPHSAGSQVRKTAVPDDVTLLAPNLHAGFCGNHIQILDSIDPETNHTTCRDSLTDRCPSSLGTIPSAMSPVSKSTMHSSPSVAEADVLPVEDLLFDDF
ncbi:hypothetical protein BDU57DRAFT_67452 [Ampelomyces quisqualis]|uniref:Uncharacterized protein n=1 Tax=Ampelomyces quisqualis TaxID=50730 RepID=A0A6A5R1I9_AMPQU|nr:hypothetical protein BDU57DRAFT_67452 [Ampelomyces quisqualis]